MLVISNHVQQIGMEIPKDAVIRINIAWAGTDTEIRRIAGGFPNNEIWVDFPTGRRKPPQPRLTLLETIEVCRTIVNVAYFAFSNAEDRNLIDLIRALVPETIKLVPKIETKLGVENLKTILDAAQTNLVMLDKEDLYVDCGADPATFNSYVARARACCKDQGAECLELKGVIFA